MKRVLHQEWLEKWLAGEDVEFKSIGSSEFKQFTNSYTLDMFEDATYTFRTAPKLLTIDVNKFTKSIREECDKYGCILGLNVMARLNESVVSGDNSDT